MLILSGATILSLVLLLHSAISADRYTRTFIYLAIGFIVFFYMLPLWTAEAVGSLKFAGVFFRFDSAEIASASLAMLVFCAGFAIANWFLSSRTVVGAAAGKAVIQRNRPGFEALSFSVVLLLAIYSYWTGQYENVIAIRREEADASHVFATMLIACYYLGCFFVLRALGKNKIIKASIWTILCLLISINFVGRAFILLLISLPILHYIKTPGLAISAIATSFYILLPFIVSGKELIYAIMNGNDFFGIAIDAYYSSSKIADVFGGVSHALISYINAPTLIEKFGGYRWFWDIPQGFIFYLRLLGFNIEDSLTYYNTESLVQIRQSIIPPGYLAFGYIQAGMAGVLMSGMIFRFLGWWVGLLRAKFQGDSLSADFFFAFLAANSFYIGEPRSMVLTLLFPCLVIYFIILFSQTFAPNTQPRLLRESTMWRNKSAN